MRRLTVARASGGWQVVEEHNARVVRTVTYTDWHRVERALHYFERAGDPAFLDLWAETSGTTSPA